MTNTYIVGGEIDAWCTKCKLELGHTIVAMVNNAPKKVKCNTCNGLHNYRTGPSDRDRSRTKSVQRRSKSKSTAYDDYFSRLTAADPSKSRQYSLKGVFEKDEIINHPTFGTGIVLSVINENKIEVLFKDGPKLLGQKHSQ